MIGLRFLAKDPGRHLHICENHHLHINSLSTNIRNVRWLGEEALKRYLKLRPPSFVPNREEVSFLNFSIVFTFDFHKKGG